MVHLTGHRRRESHWRITAEILQQIYMRVVIVDVPCQLLESKGQVPYLRGALGGCCIVSDMLLHHVNYIMNLH